MSTPPSPSASQPAPQSSWIWLVAIALGAIWMGYLAFFWPRGRFSARQVPELAASGNYGRADASWTLRDMDGKPVDFQQFRGRPIFLNVWATWCPPCVAEMPSINRLASNPRVKDVAFLCVSVEENAQPVGQFAKEHSLTVPVYLGGAEAPRVFQTEGIPATFLIDRDGNVVAKEIGSRNWDDEKVIATLENLAK